MSRTLYRNGAIYSTHDPFATALLVDGATVAWLGSEEAADGMAGGDVTVVDLAGALVTPGLYDSAFAVPGDPGDAVDASALGAAATAAGCVAITLRAAAGTGFDAVAPVRALAAEAENPASGLPEARVWAAGTLREPRDAEELHDAVGPHLAGVEAAPDDRDDAAALTAHLIAATRAGLSTGWAVGAAAELDAVRAALPAAAAEGAPLRTAGVHLAVSVDLDAEDRSVLARHGVTVLVTPSAGTPLRTPLAGLAADGVPLVLGSAAWDGAGGDPVSPWALVRACVQHPDPAQRLSSRAAFLALSRGGWRAAHAAHPLLGQLVPGAPASCAVWEATELMVQTPDSTVAAWSTDPRARTPLLPALDTGSDPRCLRTLREGLVVHDDGTLQTVPQGS
ncbi:hypothetical protein [Tersicoccus sp. Bi-70]|uniref:hypothetical protein n=1 Tax=Tersicoccus sp. Bi-70 TaxID=1897634 RepID=UPI0009773F07|nr:hypothetical protein [Tersicoccus sp. Bi-70]OMH33007.1 hypothetical protein BGP79_05425 [Tersicoccus sp. Bi-70]